MDLIVVYKCSWTGTKEITGLLRNNGLHPVALDRLNQWPRNRNPYLPEDHEFPVRIAVPPIEAKKAVEVLRTYDQAARKTYYRYDRLFMAYIILSLIPPLTFSLYLVVVHEARLLMILRQSFLVWLGTIPSILIFRLIFNRLRNKTANSRISNLTRKNK